MNIKKINKDIVNLSKGEHSLEEVMRFAGWKQWKTPKPPKGHGKRCPMCSGILSVSINTYGGEVFQRVVSCDNCGWCNFNKYE